MRHLKEYEERELIDSMKGLNLSPKTHSYYIVFSATYMKNPFVEGWIFITENFLEGVLDLFTGEGMVDLIVDTGEGMGDDRTEKAIKEQDIRKVMGILGNAYSEGAGSFTYAIWKLKPKSYKHTVEKIYPFNPYECMEKIKEYFVDYKQVFKETPDIES
jgi:hypothetical protein